MEKTTYLSSIISALNKLNGMGSLNEIYDVIEKEGRLSYIFSNPNWKDNVRATIQRHCIQTKSYRGSEDLFRSLYMDWVRVTGNSKILILQNMIIL